MTHRKHSRTRNRIHKGMARNPGQRAPKWMRLAQAHPAPIQKVVVDLQKTIESAQAEKPKHFEKPTSKPTKGFLRRLFNRKTGGS